MKKLLVLGLTVTVIFASFAAFSLALADEGTIVTKTADVKTTPAKGCAGGMKSCSPGACTPEQMAACSAKLGLSADECTKYCQSDKYQVVRMTIAGMADAAAEEAVRSTLATTPGVEKVGRVSSADGTAIVVFNDPSPASGKGAIRALDMKGFKADVAPMEMTTQSDVKTVSAPKKGCAATCGAAAAASCAAKKEPCAGSKTTETKKTDGTK
jgi:hypothetical protein